MDFVIDCFAYHLAQVKDFSRLPMGSEPKPHLCGLRRRQTPGLPVTLSRARQETGCCLNHRAVGYWQRLRTL